MKNWKEYLIDRKLKVKDAIKMLDKFQCIFVVNEDMELFGTITDRDIRKALLNQINKDAPVTKIMNKNPNVFFEPLNYDKIREAFKEGFYQHYPIINQNNQIVGVQNNNELQKIGFDNPIIIMAGGLGKRLAPLTDECPKPMLKIGNKPLLATILDGISEQGFKNVFISVNYKSDIIKNFIQDGNLWDLNISYIHEDKPLGTAGSIGNISSEFKDNTIVINGDLLTKVNYRSLLDFHIQKKSSLTLGVREFDFTVPYGVVEIKNSKAKKLIEKPIIKKFINAGIYVLSPSTIKKIPKNKFFNMTDLIEPLMKKGSVFSYPIYEYWLDIGKMEDFNKADNEYTKVFSK